MSEKTVDFTIEGMCKDNATELAIWIELELFNTIRNDADADNINWLKFWIGVIDKLNAIDWSNDESRRISEVSK